MPEKPFYFEDKEQITDEEMEKLIDFLAETSPSYKNGIYSVWLDERTYTNNSSTYYYFEALASDIDDQGNIIQSPEREHWGIQIRKQTYDNYKYLTSLASCTQFVLPNFTKTSYKIDLDDVSDTLKKQIFNLIYELLVEYKQIEDSTLEK